MLPSTVLRPERLFSVFLSQLETPETVLDAPAAVSLVLSAHTDL